MESAVSMETENVIWESATFDAVSVRLSAQRHGVRTDASTRYEKSLDPLLASFATARIFDYLHFLGKNINITAHGSYLDESQVKHIKLEVSYDFINTKAGIEIPEEKVNAILTSLGFEFSVVSTSPSDKRELKGVTQKGIPSSVTHPNLPLSGKE
jgi:phenylalanyl-tRNA synthetase beta chain